MTIYYVRLSKGAYDTLVRSGWRVTPLSDMDHYEVWHPRLELLPVGLKLVRLKDGTECIRRANEPPFFGESRRR